MTMAMQKQYCGFKSLAAHLCIWSIFSPLLTVNKWSSSDSAYKINLLDNILENFVMTEVKKKKSDGLCTHTQTYVNSDLLNTNQDA